MPALLGGVWKVTVTKEEEMNICSESPSPRAGGTVQTRIRRDHGFKLFLLESISSATTEKHLRLPGHLLHPLSLQRALKPEPGMDVSTNSLKHRGMQV